MSDENDNVFEFDAARFQQENPDYKLVNYIPLINKKTGAIVYIPSEAFQTKSQREIIDRSEKICYEFSLVKQKITQDKVKHTAQWLRDDSKLVHLVAMQLASELLGLYNHLIKSHLETDRPIEKKLLYRYEYDEDGNLSDVSILIDEHQFEVIVKYLEENLYFSFEQLNSWQAYAKDILNIFSASVWNKIKNEQRGSASKSVSYTLLEKLFEKHINEYMSGDLEQIISPILHNYSRQIVAAFVQNLDLENLSFATLNEILGIKKENPRNSTPVTEPPLSNQIVPIVSGAPILTTAMALIGKSIWQQGANKVAYCQYRAKGNPNNYIEHYITNHRDLQTLPWEQAEQIIEKFGFNTVKLHLLFAAHTMNQIEPWKNKFTLKGSDIIKELGWDKRNDLAAYEKLNEIANTGYALGCLLLKAVWVEGHGRNKVDCSISTSLVWDVMVDVRSGQLDFEGKIDRPHEVYLTVRPGLWVEKFLNEAGTKAKEALYQFGYLAKQVLKIDPYHDELALRLAIHLTMESRIHRSGEYRVKTLLEAPPVLTTNTLDSCRKNKHKAYELKRRWDSALKLLMNLGWQVEFDESYPGWLKPGSKQKKPFGWREFKILDWLLNAKITIKPPAPIPELLVAKLEQKKLQSKPQLTSSIGLTAERIRLAREAKGWTQRQLAGWMGVTQTLIGYWEKGKRTPSGDKEAKLKQLLEIAD
jgi:DNA-binding transcriptional regulator YiaG